LSLRKIQIGEGITKRNNGIYLLSGLLVNILAAEDRDWLQGFRPPLLPLPIGHLQQSTDSESNFKIAFIIDKISV